MTQLSLPDVEAALDAMIGHALANEQRYCTLDGAAGDGDFGTSLCDGFRAVRAGGGGYPRDDVGAFLRAVAMTVTSKMGGSSGPIWGTGFLKAGLAAKGKETLSLADVAALHRAALDGIMQRGGAALGDKTLVDALSPATEAFERHAAADPGGDLLAAYDDATSAAHDAIEGTRNLTAMKGRASFLAERSQGTVDPGVVAVAEMFRVVTDTLRERGG